MRAAVFAISALMMAALTATVAIGQMNLPWAAAPTSVEQNKTITLDFNNAPAQDVFNALRKAGVNFAAETTAIAKDKRVTVHVKNQPVDKAVEAVAGALGLSVTKNGNIYSLRPGFMVGSDAFKVWKDGFTPNTEHFYVAPDGKDFKFEMPKGQWKSFGEGFKWSGPDGKAFKFEMPEGDWKKFGEEFKQAFPEGQWKSFGENMGKWGDQLHKKLEKYKGKDEKDLTPEEKADIERIVEEHMKAMPEMKEFKFDKLPELELKMKGLEGHLKAGPMAELRMKELKDHLKQLPHGELKLKEIEPKVLERLHSLKDIEPKLSKIKVGMEGIDKLFASLTPDQLAKQDKNGYLTLEDLTAEQRKMLGDWASGSSNIELAFTKDGKTIRIKSKS